MTVILIVICIIVIVLSVLVYLMYKKLDAKINEPVEHVVSEPIVQQPERIIVEKEVTVEVEKDTSKSVLKHIQDLTEERERLQDLVKNLHESTTSQIAHLTKVNKSLLGAVRLQELTIETYASQLEWVEEENMIRVIIYISIYEHINKSQIRELCDEYNKKHNTNITIDWRTLE